MFIFVCYPKCSTCKKAKDLLDSLNVKYEIRDIKTNNPTFEELKVWVHLSKLPVSKFFNTSGILYRTLNLKDKIKSMSENECLELLATDGMLVKRPILVSEHRVLVGFKQNDWESVA